MSQRDRLPQGWTISPIRDLCERVVVGFVGPSKQHYAFHGVPFLTGKNIKNGKLNLSKFDKVSHAFHEAQQKSQLQANDVVVIRIGRSGEAAVVPENLGPANCGGLVICKQPHRVLPRYLAHYLNSPHGQQASKAEVRGVTRSTLNTKSIERALVPVAPLPEQKRIADKLDRLLAAVDTCKARLDAIPDILKRFRRSVLAAAVSGELTEEWRQGRADVSARRLGLPKHWKLLNVADVCEAIVDCPHSTPKWTHTGRICVRTTDFRAGRLDLSSAKYVSEETYKERTRRIEPREGDVLYSREGTVGVACPVPPGVSICLGQRILLLRPSTLIHSAYLMHVLNSPATMRIVSQLTIGSTAPRVNVSNVKSFPLALPPLEEQGEIVRRIGSLLATADLIERALAAACVGTEVLARSVLEKAFRGEIVPPSLNRNLAILNGGTTDLSTETSPAALDHSSSSCKRRALVG